MAAPSAAPGATGSGRGRITGEGLIGLALVAAPLALLFLLIVLPTLAMIWGTLQVQGETGTGLGLGRFAAFFADDYAMANLRYTVIWTLLSCITALGLALGLALYLRFSEGPVATMIHALSLFPLFVPAIIISYALVRFLGPNGLLQLLLERVGIAGYHSPYLTPIGPFIGYVWESIPLPVLVIGAGLAQVSDHAVEAARDLGARPWRIFCEILLPQIRRSLMIAFALIFLGVIGAFTLPYLLGPPAPEMMSVFMQRTFGNLQKPQEAQVQAVILLAIASAAGAIYIATMLRAPVQHR